jgi:hypothetical protein
MVKKYFRFDSHEKLLIETLKKLLIVIDGGLEAMRT